MYEEGRVIKLYWADLDVWLSSVQVGKEGNEILGTTYSSNPMDALSFYVNESDYRYNNAKTLFMNQLVQEGLVMVDKFEPLKRTPNYII